MKIYLDTSFLVSLYSADTNSTNAARTIRAFEGLYLASTLTELEGKNALQLRVFRKEISRAEATSSLRALEKDLSEGVFQLVRIPDQAFERAQIISGKMTGRLGIRTADLLHLAAALELRVDYLFSFDSAQRKLAQRLRLKVN